MFSCLVFFFFASPADSVYKICIAKQARILDHSKPPASSDIWKEYGRKASFSQDVCPLRTCLTITSGNTDAKLERAIIISWVGGKLSPAIITILQSQVLKTESIILFWAESICFWGEPDRPCFCSLQFKLEHLVFHLELCKLKKKYDSPKKAGKRDQMQTVAGFVCLEQWHNTLGRQAAAKLCRWVHYKWREAYAD